MNKIELLQQAERADRLADQSTDDQLVHTLRDAANDYRHAAQAGDQKSADSVGSNG